MIALGAHESGVALRSATAVHKAAVIQKALYKSNRGFISTTFWAGHNLISRVIGYTTYMPVNPLPVLISLFLLWCAGVYFLLRWRRSAGAAFIVISLIALAFHVHNTNVQVNMDEQMPFQIVNLGANHWIQFTNSHGDTATCDFAPTNLVSQLQISTNKTVHVVMTGWYDYGHLGWYHITSIDGVSMP